MNILKYPRRFLGSLRYQQIVRNARTMFTIGTLELETYQRNRHDAENNVESPHHFKWELQTYIENEPDKDAVSLKNAIEVLVHLVQPDNDDFKLVKDTLYAYNSIENVTDKAKRSIGNMVMKAAHSLNRSDEAFELYNDPQLSSFFAGFKSTLLCLDLLYLNGKYDRIIQIDAEKRQSLWPNQSNFSKFIDVLVFGACYKLNTKDSFDYAQKLWSTIGHTRQFKRSVAFVATLALNQSQPNTSIQTLKNLDEYFVTEQIKLMALADLSYTNETIETLSLWTEHENLSQHKICKDVIERIRESLREKSTISALQQFQEIYAELVTSDRISDETLNGLLDRPISSRIGFRGKRSITESSILSEIFS